MDMEGTPAVEFAISKAEFVPAEGRLCNQRPMWRARSESWRSKPGADPMQALPSVHVGNHRSLGHERGDAA